MLEVAVLTKQKDILGKDMETKWAKSVALKTMVFTTSRAILVIIFYHIIRTYPIKGHQQQIRLLEEH